MKLLGQILGVLLAILALIILVPDKLGSEIVRYFRGKR